jgi:hypothetical protein
METSAAAAVQQKQQETEEKRRQQELEQQQNEAAGRAASPGQDCKGEEEEAAHQPGRHESQAEPPSSPSLHHKLLAPALVSRQRSGASDKPRHSVSFGKTSGMASGQLRAVAPSSSDDGGTEAAAKGEAAGDPTGEQRIDIADCYDTVSSASISSQKSQDGGDALHDEKSEPAAAAAVVGGAAAAVTQAKPTSRLVVLSTVPEAALCAPPPRRRLGFMRVSNASKAMSVQVIASKQNFPCPSSARAQACIPGELLATGSCCW